MILPSTALNINKSSNDSNKHLNTVKRKLGVSTDFNPEPNKQATEAVFLVKEKQLIFYILNSSLVSSAPLQKHLGLILDEKRIIRHHLKLIICYI